MLPDAARGLGPTVGGIRATDPSEQLLGRLVDLATAARELYLPTRIPVLHAEPDPLQFYREHVAMSRPCVFEAGALADVAAWTAHRKWTRAHLTATMGDSAVAVEVTPHGHGDAIADGLFVMPDTQRMTVAEFFGKQDLALGAEVGPDARTANAGGRGTAAGGPARPFSMSPPSPATAGSLAGVRVHIDDIGSRPELNGRRGTAVSYDPETDRYGVRVDPVGDPDHPGYAAAAAAVPCVSLKAGKLAAAAVPAGPDGPKYYISHQDSNLTDQFGQLLADVAAPQLATAAFGCRPDATNIWLGPDMAVTSTHKDHYENFYTVIRGRKVFTLYPPTDAPFLHQAEYRSAKYRARTSGGSGSGSGREDAGTTFDVVPLPDGELGCTRPWIPIDPDAPDLARHPRYVHATPVTVTVGPGQSLYLPSLWFHRVAQVGDADIGSCTLAVNFWYDMAYGPQYAYFRAVEALGMDVGADAGGGGRQPSAPARQFDQCIDDAS